MQAGMENPLFRIISQSQKKDNEPMTQQSNVNINTQFGSTVASNNQNMAINNNQYISGNQVQLNPFANQISTVVSPGQDNIQTVYNPNQTIQGEIVKTIDPTLNQTNNQQSIFGSQTTGQDSKMTIKNQLYLSGNNIGTNINNNLNNSINVNQNMNNNEKNINNHGNSMEIKNNNYLSSNIGSNMNNNTNSFVNNRGNSMEIKNDNYLSGNNQVFNKGNNMDINNNNYISNTGANTLLTNNNVNSTDVNNTDSNNNSNNNSDVKNNTNMSAISFKNNAQNSEISIINEQNNFQNMINQQINSLTYSIEKISRDVKTLLNNQVMINNEISSLKSIVEQFIQGAKSESYNVSSYNVIFRRDCKTQTLLNIEVKENDNVETLMSKYKNKSNYNGNIKLLFNAKILENEQTCKDIGLINGSTIYVLDFEILKGA